MAKATDRTSKTTEGRVKATDKISEVTERCKGDGKDGQSDG